MTWCSKACGLLLLMASAAVSAAPAADDCEIDEMMRAARVEMDKMAVGIYDNNVAKPIGAATEAAPNVKDASCLPMLDTLDGLLRMRIPSIGGAMSGIMSKVRDMACDMANGYLEQLANRAQVNVSDPLGVVSIGVGATTGTDGGISVEEYDFGKVVEDAAINSAGSVIKGSGNEARQVINQLPNGVQNRTPRIESTVRQEVNSAINGL